MPAGTKVHRCVQKLTSKYGKVSAIKICQASTKQSYKTGRSTKGRSKRSRKR